MDALTRGRFRQQLASAPDEARLSELGLRPPRFRVTAAFEDGRQLTLEGGREQAFDGSVPLRRSGDPAVYAAGGDVRHALERTSDGLRARLLLPFPAEQVRSLEVRATSDDSWRLERDGTGAWMQREAPAFEADAAAVRRLLQAASRLRARDFAPDTPAQRATHGLSGRLLEARFTPIEGAPVTLRFAPPNPGATAPVWAQREEGEVRALVLLEPRAPSLLAVEREALRSRALIAFDQPEVTRIAMTPAGDAPVFTLIRVPGATDEAWALEVEGLGTRPVDRYRAAALLWSLSSLRSAPRAPAPGPLVPATGGLREVRVFGREDRPLGRFTLGGADPETPGLRQVETGMGTRRLVAADRLAALPSGPGDLIPPPPDGR